MNRYKIRYIATAIAGFMCLAVILLTLRIKIAAVHGYRDIFNQWNKDLVNLKVAPTPENIFFLQREYEWIIGRESELRKLLLNKGISIQGLTPLQFKEELLNSQTKLKQFADIQGSKIQGDLGFPEYASGEIPQPGEVALLTKQLAVINELVNLLLKHKVIEVNSITRLPGVSAKGDIYQEMAFKIELQSTLEDLLGVLQDLINAAQVLVVKDLKINKLDEGRIGVEMLIGVCEFT